jgi:hypothetical protein
MKVATYILLSEQLCLGQCVLTAEQDGIQPAWDERLRYVLLHRASLHREGAVEIENLHFGHRVRRSWLMIVVMLTVVVRVMMRMMMMVVMRRLSLTLRS